MVDLHYEKLLDEFFDIRNNQCRVNTTKSLHYSGCYRNRIYNCFIIHWFEENNDKQHRCKYNKILDVYQTELFFMNRKFRKYKIRHQNY